MGLPINNALSYKLTIPSTGKQVRFRPFLVKDEKALLTAQQSEDIDVVLATIKNVIKDCLHGEINPDELAIFDIEYIFVQIRTKSVGEISELYFKCGSCDDKNNKVKIDLDLTKIQVHKSENHTNKFHLFNDVGIVLKYPGIDIIKLMDKETKTPEDVFEMVINCIDYIYTDDEMFYAKEQTREELVRFLDNLTSEQFDKLSQFFDTMPVFKEDVSFKCPACGTNNKTVLRGIESFF